MAWSVYEDALRSWVKTISGLDDQHLFWAYQDGARPPETYITLAFGAITPVGQDMLLTNYDAGRAAGAEIRHQVIGFREVGFQVTVRSPGLTSGDYDAMAIASKLQTALRLPTIRDSLNAVGLSPFDEGHITYLPVIFGTGFEGRAILEIRCYVSETLAEFVTYIQTVNGVAQPSNVSFQLKGS